MRLIFKVRAISDIPQPLPTHWLQGWVYSLLRGTDYDFLRHEYEYFCFSNIFPVEKNGRLKKGNEYYFMISSCDNDFIFSIADLLKNVSAIMMDENYILQIRDVAVAKADLGNREIKSETPIIISIKDNVFLNSRLDLREKPVFWTQQMPLKNFIDGLTKNLIQKYNKFYKKDLPETLSLFDKAKLINKTAALYHTPGNLWNFIVQESNDAKKVISLCMDAGFGEKNIAGYGFINSKGFTLK